MVFPTHYVSKPPIGAQPILGHPLTPTAAWLFNEGSGLKAFDIIGRNHGTLGAGAAAPTWVAGRNGLALDFDGTDDHIDCGNAMSLRPATISVLTWIKTPSTFKLGGGSSYQGVISRYDWGVSKRVWGIALNNKDGDWQPNDRLAILLGDPNDGTVEYIGRYEQDLSTDTNYHIAFTFDSGTLVFYLNGVETSLTTVLGAVPASLFSTDTDLTLGTFLNNEVIEDPSKTRQDEARIYDHELSASEIWQLHINPYCWLAQPMEAELMYVAPSVGLSIPVAYHHYEALRVC